MSAAEIVGPSQANTDLMLMLMVPGHIFRLVKACWIGFCIICLTPTTAWTNNPLCVHVICCADKTYEISEQTISAVIQDTSCSVLGWGWGEGTHPKF